MRTFKQFVFNEDINFWSDSIIDNIFNSVLDKLYQIVKEPGIRYSYRTREYKFLEISKRANSLNSNIKYVTGIAPLGRYKNDLGVQEDLYLISKGHQFFNGTSKLTVTVKPQFPPLFSDVLNFIDANTEDEERIYQAGSKFLQSNGFVEILNSNGFVKYYRLEFPEKYITQADITDVDAQSSLF